MPTLTLYGVVSHHSSAAIGFIIDNGNPLVAGAKKPRSLNAPTTEALVFREGLITALQKGIKKIQVERNSKLIIYCILGLFLFLADLMVSCIIDIKELA